MNSQMVIVPSTPVGGSHVFQCFFSYLCFLLSPHLYVHYINDLNGAMKVVQLLS